LRVRGRQYEPDVILLNIVTNDIDPHASGRTEIDKKLLFPERSEMPPPKGGVERFYEIVVANSALLTSFQSLARQYVSGKKHQSYGKHSPRWLDAELALRGIIDICRKDDIVLITYLYGNTELPHVLAIHNLYRKVLKDEGVPTYTLPTELFHYKYYNSFIDRHPNASGHKEIANQMYEALKPVFERMS